MPSHSSKNAGPAVADWAPLPSDLSHLLEDTESISVLADCVAIACRATEPARAPYRLGIDINKLAGPVLRDPQILHREQRCVSSIFAEQVGRIIGAHPASDRSPEYGSLRRSDYRCSTVQIQSFFRPLALEADSE